MMTRRLNYSWIRSVFALILGVFLVMYPGEASLYLVMMIGLLFLLPGIIALWSFFVDNHRQFRTFPVLGLGSSLLGIWLLVMPGFFIAILMYVLGIMLILAGINLIGGLMSACRYTTISLGFYVIPILISLAGLLVLFNPFTSASIPFIILGISSIVYALSDLFNAYRFRNVRTKAEEIIINESDDTTQISQDTDK